MTDARSLTVVIPVYNAATSLPRLMERLHSVLGRAAAAFEVILVNDGSTDGSWEVIQTLCRQHAFVRGIDFTRNYGQHNALLCGIRAARHEVVVTMDDDLQHPPEEVVRLVAALTPGHDVVYGVPEHERHGFWRPVASRFTKLALRHAAGAATARQVSAFRAFRTPLRGAFAGYQGALVSIDVLLAWGTTRIGSVVVRHDPRAAGRSNYNFPKLVGHTLNMLTGFSTWPLRLASLMGFGLALFGLVVLTYVLWRRVMEGASVPGFAFLAAIIAIFSGTQLFALGIIGEYLGRMHLRLMDRPPYTVRETTDTG